METGGSSTDEDDVADGDGEDGNRGGETGAGDAEGSGGWGGEPGALVAVDTPDDVAEPWGRRRGGVPKRRAEVTRVLHLPLLHVP